MLTLDILEKLDDFKESFPIEYYKAHLDDYFSWLEKMVAKNDKLALDIYFHMRRLGKYPDIVKKLDVLLEKLSPSYILEQEGIKLRSTQAELYDTQIALKNTKTKLDNINITLNKTKTDLKSAKKRIDFQKSKIEALYNSNSWKITKPFRAVKQLIRK